MDKEWDRKLVRLFVGLAITCFLGWLFKGHCAPGGWTHSEQYTTGCYSDAVPFWGLRGVAAGQVPFFQAQLEYPVLTGALIWIEGLATRLLFGSGTGAAHFLFVVTLANALLAACVLWDFWRAGMDMRRLWLWAAAPPLILYVGHNWDMLAVTFAVSAMLLAREGRLVASAGAAGLGVAAKLFPIVLLPLLGLGALFGRAERRRGSRQAFPTVRHPELVSGSTAPHARTGKVDERMLKHVQHDEGGGPGGTPDWAARFVLAARVTAVAIGAWALVNVPVALLATENWLEFYRFSSERGGTAASSWQLLSDLQIWYTQTPERNFWAAVLFVLGAGAIIALGWRRHADRLWVLFPAVLAWFMLTNKVYSPQFDLWFYPLALMTAPRLAPLALFVVAGIAAYFAEFWFFAGMEGAWPTATTGELGIAAAIRAAAMLWLIVDAVRLPPAAWLDAAGRETGLVEAATR